MASNLQAMAFKESGSDPSSAEWLSVLLLFPLLDEELRDLTQISESGDTNRDGHQKACQKHGKSVLFICGFASCLLASVLLATSSNALATSSDAPSY